MSNADLTSRTRLFLLTLGAIGGLVLAASNLVENWSAPSRGLPGDAVARVGDRLITRDRFQQLINDLAADKRAPLDNEDQQFALDRLIDEELMIMRGVELGLVETSPEVRKTIASKVIMQVVTEAQANVPDDADLLSLYDSDPDFFSPTHRYRVHWWRLDGQEDESPGNNLDVLRQAGPGADENRLLSLSGFERVMELPDTLLPMSKLIDYMGPVLAQQLTLLEAGGFSQAIDSNRALHILHLADQITATLSPFEDVRTVVEREYQRRKGDQALRDYLTWLRKRTEIIIVEPRP